MAATKIWAHRGDRVHHLENTLEAFEGALQAGADGVELDVRLCATGEVVVFHDATLERLAGVEDAVASLPLSRLRALRLEGGARIPTLEEALEATRPLEVNVELKVETVWPTGLEAAVLEVLRRTGSEDRVLLSCFHPAALFRLRQMAPRLPRALLFEAPRAALFAPLVAARALHPDASLVTPARLRLWRRLARAVNVWTVNDPAAARRLSVWGVDGIITDDPAGIRDALMGLPPETSAPSGRGGGPSGPS